HAHDVGPHTDVYGLGVILYELLTGRPPFKGKSHAETLERVKHDDPVTPRRERRDVPRDLETICLKCLEKDPRRRYSTARELSPALQRFLAGEPVLARPRFAFERAGRWLRQRPTLAAAAVVLVALASAVVTAAGYWTVAFKPRPSSGNLKRVYQDLR